MTLSKNILFEFKYSLGPYMDKMDCTKMETFSINYFLYEFQAIT